MGKNTLPDIVFDTIHYGVTLCASLYIIAFVAFYMSHHQDKGDRHGQPGEIVRTPDDGVISYTRPASDATSGGPWCYVVQKITFANKDPKDGAASMVYARTCEELPMLWLNGRG